MLSLAASSARSLAARSAFRTSAQILPVGRRYVSKNLEMPDRDPLRFVQSYSPIAPLGVDQAIKAENDPNYKPKVKIFEEFALNDRVAVVTGARRGLGLEMALALCEQGAKVYALDLPETACEEFEATKKLVQGFSNGSKLHYRQANVTDQKGMWDTVAEIGKKEGRLDVCVAAAGILKAETDCLEESAEQFKQVMDVNVNGVMYTAQAAGREMARTRTPGSIILIASMSGTVTNKDHRWTSYNTSKSAVLQMGRSMACELAEKSIRVNTVSPGHIYTSMTAAFLDKQPQLLAKWSGLNPMGRIGRPDEMRGVIAWLASDASSFCTGSDIIVSGGHTIW